jgi:hypothetical protein
MNRALFLIWRQWENLYYYNPGDAGNPVYQARMAGGPIPHPLGPQMAMPHGGPRGAHGGGYPAFGAAPHPPMAFRYAHQVNLPVGAVAATLQINNKIKMSDIKTWDGNSEDLVTWIKEINSLAQLTEDAELGQSIPYRLTAEAKDWWNSLTQQEQTNYSTSWTNMKDGILAQWATPDWYNRRQREAMQSRFRDPGHEAETPLQYANRKRQMFTLMQNPMTDANLIHYILAGAPDEWRDVLPPDQCLDWVSFRYALNTYHDRLLKKAQESDTFKKAQKRIDKAAAAMEVYAAAAKPFFKAAKKGKDERKKFPFSREKPPTANRAYKSFYTGTPIDSVVSPKGAPYLRGQPGCKVCKSGMHTTYECPQYAADKAAFREWKIKQETGNSKKTAAAAPYNHAMACAALGINSEPEYSSSDESSDSDSDNAAAAAPADSDSDNTSQSEN